MPLQFIIGRSGTGKTEEVLNNIRTALKKSPDGPPIIYLVPDQMTFEMERKMALTPGLDGMTRFNVFSFQRLALRILQQTGKLTRYHLTNTGISMLLQKIVEEEKEHLKVFQKASEQRGFFDMLSGTLTEFKRYLVTPEELAAKKDALLKDAEGTEHTLLQNKLDDLRIIYERMESELLGKYIDSEDYLSLMYEQIAESDWAASADVYIDGFDVLTPQQIQVIQCLMEHSKKVTVLLTCEEADLQKTGNHLLFRQNAANFRLLHEAAMEANIEIEEPVIFLETHRYNTLALQHLERYFETRPFVIQHDTQGMMMTEAVNRREEINQAARQILSWVRDQGLRYKEIALLVRNLQEYAPLVNTIFKDYDIPIFLDQKRPMRNHPLIELIRSSLEVIRQNWRYETVFRAVKTNLIQPIPKSGDVDREGMDLLENYVIAYGIHGDRWKNKERFAERQLKGSSREKVDMDLIESMRLIIVEPLRKLENRLKKADSLLKMGEAIYAFLIDCDIPVKLERLRDRAEQDGRLEEAREHDQVWQAVMDTLDQLMEAAGSEQIRLDLFAKILDTGLDGLEFALVPPALDQVVIGSMDRSRVANTKAVMVLGINEGVIPAMPSENGILSDDDRSLLSESGLELALDTRALIMEEEFLIYRALTSPTDYLYLSYPLADEEGKAMIPSSLIGRLTRMFPELSAELVMSEPHDRKESEPLTFVTSPYRTLSGLAAELRQVKKGYPVADVWWDVYNWYRQDPLWSDQAGKVLSSLFFSNQPSLTQNTAQVLYGKNIRASVSRMELYNACPFSQFANYGLRLKERQVYRLEAPDIGQFFHDALKEMTQQLIKEKRRWRDLSTEECMDFASQFTKKIGPRLQSEILMSSNRHQYLQYKLEQVIQRAAKVFRKHDMASGFAPVGLELPFGPHAQLPPLVFQLDNGCRMEIIGRIDRVDQAVSEQGIYLRIIDYKSSAKELNLTDIYYGLALQMLTYLDVVVTHAKDWLGVEASPAGMLYFHVHNPMLNITEKLSEEEIEARLMKAFKMRGLLLEDEGVVRTMDYSFDTGQSSIVPAAIKKDGSFYKTSSVANLKSFQTLRSFTRKMIHEVGQGITNGNISIAPYKLKDRTPCQFCQFKPVCQFDQSKDNNQYRFLKKQDDLAAFEELTDQKGVEADGDER